EFDLERKEFLPDGFKLPEFKSRIAWRTRDAVYVGTDFGPGSLTKSGYPRLVKEWKRGKPLSEARLVYVRKEADVSVGAVVEHDHGRVDELLTRAVTFFTDEVSMRRGDDWVKIDKPADAGVHTYGEYLLLQLRTDWAVGGQNYTAGSLLAANFEDYLKGE